MTFPLMATSKKEIVKHPHHQQSEFCLTRAKYRQGRKLTAVKVYTVNNESVHLLIVGVPALGLQDDLRRVCSRYGDVKSLVFVPGYSEEEFTDSYHVQYSKIQSARHAKRRLDGMSFYGGVLHVCYAPEMETVAETRAKLVQRRKDVACRINGRMPNSNGISTFKDRRKDGRGAQSFNSKKARYDGPSSASSGCIWKGQLVTNDPRTAKVEEAPAYGPTLPEGVRPEALTSADAEDPAKSAADFSWTSRSKFIPRQITLKKAIVFRKKSGDEEGKTDEDNSLLSTQKHIKDVLDKVAEPNVSVNLSKVQSALNME